MDRRAYLVAVAGASSAIAGCSDVTGMLTGGDYDVGMTRMDFEPEIYEVTEGETVVWKNTSDALHTVTAYDVTFPGEAAYFASGGYDSYEAAKDAWNSRNGGAIDVRETYEHTFTVPGEYWYACIPHEVGGMIGAIVVREK